MKKVKFRFTPLDRLILAYLMLGMMGAIYTGFDGVHVSIAGYESQDVVGGDYPLFNIMTVTLLMIIHTLMLILLSHLTFKHHPIFTG